MNPEHERKFEGFGKSHEQPRELSDDEQRDQQAHYAQLNEMMYGDSDGFAPVEASRYRETVFTMDQSDTLAAAELGAEEYSEAAVKSRFIGAQERINATLGSYGAEVGRESGTDVRMAAEVRRADMLNTLSDEGTLNETAQIRAEKSQIAEELISDYMSGKATGLFDTMSDQAAHAAKSAIGALLQKYGDHTKASNEELERVFTLIEAGQNTADTLFATEDESNFTLPEETSPPTEAPYNILDELTREQ